MRPNLRLKDLLISLLVGIAPRTTVPWFLIESANISSLFGTLSKAERSNSFFLYNFFNSLEPVLSFSAKTTSNPNTADKRVLSTNSAKVYLGHGHWPIAFIESSFISKIITLSEAKDFLGEIFWNISNELFLRLLNALNGSSTGTKLINTAKGINRYLPILRISIKFS